MEKLQAKQGEEKFVCVGLDSDPAKLPPRLIDKYGEGAQYQFNRQIIEATVGVAGAYKLNRAFYGGERGYENLLLTMRYLRNSYPDMPVIGDGKWNDIGNTNAGYAKDVFDELKFTAITINPYLGMEAMKPFLDCEDKGIIILVRTSNPGAGELQDLNVEVAREPSLLGTAPDTVSVMPLYEVVARFVAEKWNYNKNCCVVAGATSTFELAKIRAIVGDMPILIPGIGAQGGDLETTVRVGANSKGQGMIINNSRGIIFAYENSPELGERNYAAAAAKATKSMHDEITAALAAA